MSQLTELISQVRGDVRGMWRHRWAGVGVAWCVAAVGAAGISLMNDRFEASARVFVDTQTVLKPLMAGLAFQPDVDQQVRMLARTLISRPTVKQLMRNPSLGLEPANPGAFDRGVDRLKDKIKFEFGGTSNLYSITYRDTDQPRAKRLVEALLNVFVEGGSNVKQRDSAEASRFIDEQIKSYEEKLAEAENRLKDFKLKNLDVTGGTTNQDYYARVSTLVDQVAKLRLDLSAAEQSRDALRKELATEDPQLPVEAVAAPVQAAAPSETEQRLSAQRRQLDELLRRYTDNHPDVQAVQRSIAALESQRLLEQRALAASAQADAKPRGGAAPTNPVYQKLRVSLAEAEANVASLRSQLSVQQGRLDQARAMAGRVPQTEAELAQLNRDYDVLRRNYEQLVARREAASLGVKIDQSSSMADFRVVEPPRVSPLPVAPGRRLLALGLVPLALLAGLLASFGLARAAGTIDDEKSLKAVTGRPVLGTVTMVVNASMQSLRRKQLFHFSGATAGLLLAAGAWMFWLVQVTRV